MRLHRAHLGIGDSSTTGSNCIFTASGYSCQTPPIAPTLPYQTAPTTPNNYQNTLPSGVIPGNTSGQTLANLPSTPEDLCTYQGGEWDASTSSCNMCPQDAISGFLMPEAWDSSTGLCTTSWTRLIMAGGAVIALGLISLFARRRR